MSTRISELPPYTGATNPVGDMPISINGVTYRITPQLLEGQNLQKVTDQGNVTTNDISVNSLSLKDNDRDLYGTLLYNEAIFYISDPNNGEIFRIDTNASLISIGMQSALGSGGDNINALGYRALINNSGSNVNAFGLNALESNSGDNVNAFGKNAGVDNQISQSTIFSNDCLPAYSNHGDAATAITVANGASANSTYLYYNSSNNTIEAIRL